MICARLIGITLGVERNDRFSFPAGGTIPLVGIIQYVSAALE